MSWESKMIEISMPEPQDPHEWSERVARELIKQEIDLQDPFWRPLKEKGLLES